MAHIATAVARQEQVLAFPRAAAAYGVAELARRAGVSREQYRLWSIQFDDRNSIKVLVQPGTGKHVRFPRMSAAVWSQIQRGAFRTSTAHWMEIPSACAFAPNLKIPFSSSRSEDVGPLFSPSGRDGVDCPLDLPASVALTLGRFEEILPGLRDEHGRFSAFSGIAWRDGFLHRPIVDEYGLAFAQALVYLLPGWRPPQRRLRVKLGHDVDDIGAPFLLRSAIGHAFKRGRPVATLRDLAAAAPLRFETAYQQLLREIVFLSLNRRLDSAVYWKASAPGPHDRGYRLDDQRTLALKSLFEAHGVEMGIHPSYQSFDSRATFRHELSAVREWLGLNNLGGRQDYLRWKPDSWLLWESMGMAYDASVGFADHVGFRAGTSHPYRPWLFSQNRQANIVEIPLLAMDTTLLRYMRMKPAAALRMLLNLISACRAVGGVFTLVWHHTNLMTRKDASAYCQLLDHLVGSDSFDWRNLSYGAD